jgi:hypothetical protein
MFNSTDKDGISFSIRDGLYMPFIYKGHQVVVHNAAWSFREKIWVDDDLLVNRIGVSMTSTHELRVAGDALTVTFGYRRGMKDVFLEARVGDELVHEINHRVAKDVKPSTLVIFGVTALIAGAALGYLAGHLVGSLIGGS